MEFSKILVLVLALAANGYAKSIKRVNVSHSKRSVANPNVLQGGLTGFNGFGSSSNIGYVQGLSAYNPGAGLPFDYGFGLPSNDFGLERALGSTGFPAADNSGFSAPLQGFGFDDAVAAAVGYPFSSPLQFKIPLPNPLTSQAQIFQPVTDGQQFPMLSFNTSPVQNTLPGNVVQQSGTVYVNNAPAQKIQTSALQSVSSSSNGLLNPNDKPQSVPVFVNSESAEKVTNRNVQTSSPQSVSYSINGPLNSNGPSQSIPVYFNNAAAQNVPTSSPQSVSYSTDGPLNSNGLSQLIPVYFNNAGTQNAQSNSPQSVSYSTNGPLNSNGPLQSIPVYFNNAAAQNVQTSSPQSVSYSINGPLNSNGPSQSVPVYVNNAVTQNVQSNSPQSISYSTNGPLNSNGPLQSIPVYFNNAAAQNVQTSSPQSVSYSINGPLNSNGPSQSVPVYVNNAVTQNVQSNAPQSVSYSINGPLNSNGPSQSVPVYVNNAPTSVTDQNVRQSNDIPLPISYSSIRPINVAAVSTPPIFETSSPVQTNDVATTPSPSGHASQAGSVPGLILELRPPTIPTSPDISNYNDFGSGVSGSNRVSGNAAGITAITAIDNLPGNSYRGAYDGPNGSPVSAPGAGSNGLPTSPSVTYSTPNVYFPPPSNAFDSTNVNAYSSSGSISGNSNNNAPIPVSGDSNVGPKNVYVKSNTGPVSNGLNDVTNAISDGFYSAPNSISANSHSDSNSIQSSPYNIPGSLAVDTYGDSKLSPDIFYSDSNSIYFNRKRESPNVASSEKAPSSPAPSDGAK